MPTEWTPRTGEGAWIEGKVPCLVLAFERSGRIALVLEHESQYRIPTCLLRELPEWARPQPELPASARPACGGGETP